MQAGEAIKKIRIRTGLTQAELADRLGVTPQVISQYERGLKNPKIETIQRIADALNVPPQELLGSTSAWAEMVAADTMEQFRKGNMRDVTKAFLNPEELESEELENRIERAYYQLNSIGRQIAVERVEELTLIPKYQRTQSAPQDAPAGPDDKEPTEK